MLICEIQYIMAKMKVKLKSQEMKSRVPCAICSSTFRNQFALRDHVEHLHEGRSYLCNICGEIIRNLKQMKLHQATHCETSQYVIFIDDKQTRYFPVTTGSYKFSRHCKKCKGCFADFQSVIEMMHHFEEIHRKRRFRCNTCNTNIIRHTDLPSHAATHKGDTVFTAEYKVLQPELKVPSFPCTECSFVHLKKRNFHWHVKAKHPNSAL